MFVIYGPNIFQEDTNHSFNSFNDTIEKLLDKHMPKRKITKKEFKQKYKHWVTNGILTSIIRRDKLLKKFIRTKNQCRKQIIHKEYKTLRNKVLDLTTKSKTINSKDITTNIPRITHIYNRGCIFKCGPAKGN